jgi:hypothetical protein
MKSIVYNAKFRQAWLATIAFALVCLSSTALGQDATKSNSPGVQVQTFATAEEAANALINAAGKFDIDALGRIFGTEGRKIVLTGERGQDLELAKSFSEQAREKTKVEVDPKDPHKAALLVGDEDWPFPAPIIEKNGRWSFDAKAGAREIANRRVGRNELDAIAIARIYADAQHEYALKPRKGYEVNQYAQRIISSPGKQDGLAWQNADGSWEGPIGKNVAIALQKGYSTREPYHGYYFKVLKAQGPAAPLGSMNFVVEGAMIGGFALVAAPARYGVTGVKTFMIGFDGVVYEKDLGPNSLNQFAAMKLYNPDKTWTPVQSE